MSLDQYLLFLTVTALFLASPGPAILLCINNGIQHGARLSAIAVLGNVLAFQILIILSAIGVGTILATSVEIFNVVKILGAMYLVYLGIKIWTSPIKPLNQPLINKKHQQPFFHFKHAFLVTASNPKALVYITALLPQFINTELALFSQIAILNVGIAFLQFFIFMAYVLLADRMRFWLQGEFTRSVFNKVTGLTFVGFGVALGLAEQNPSTPN